MAEDNGTTYNFDVCSQCKSICCKDAKPPLTRNRKKILQTYLKKHNINVKNAFSTEDYTHPATDEQLYCLLFNRDTGKCMVHPIKPETCVAGPVTFNINFCTKKVEWFLKTKELCTYAGVLYNNKFEFQEHFETAKKQIMGLIEQLSADELQALMEIDEPQTFKFCEEDLPKEVVKKLGL